MAYDVTLEPGKRLVIQNDAGPVYYAEIYTPNITSFSKVVRTTKSNSYGSVTGNIAGQAIPAPATQETQYYVRMHMNNGMHEDIILGDIPSQASWDNNDDGFGTACKDIAGHAAA